MQALIADQNLKLNDEIKEVLLVRPQTEREVVLTKLSSLASQVKSEV